MHLSFVLQDVGAAFEEEHPLITAGVQWKLIRANFPDFIKTLVKQCQFSILYDSYLMDIVVALVIGLSESQVRPLRITGVFAGNSTWNPIPFLRALISINWHDFAALTLMTALVEVSLTLSMHLENASRQYRAEVSKAGKSRATARLETLSAKRQELNENMDEVTKMIDHISRSVVMHRYNDVVPEIRAVCMTELGTCLSRLPQQFLDDSHLKYIGWNLSDKVADVRLKCLQGLQPILENKDLVGKMERFIIKFKAN